MSCELTDTNWLDVTEIVTELLLQFMHCNKMSLNGESCELTDTNWLEVTAMAVVGMPLLGKISRQSM